MNDDDNCNVTDLKNLQKICITNNLVRCDLCYHINPQAGYDYPYCKIRKDLGLDYKMNLDIIPNSCPHFLSASEEYKRQDIEHLKSQIHNLQKRLKDLEGTK